MICRFAPGCTNGRETASSETMIPREEWNLNTQRIGRRVLIFDRVDSTNTVAATLSGDVARDGLVVLADEQTAGRGQHGRSWLCQPGAGVLLSVLSFPPPAVRRPVILAAWAANAVCETIFQTIELEATIKWPNDVLIDGRKVCGILIEQGKGTVLGIGLNVNQTAASLTDAGLPQAASLSLYTQKSLDCRQVARVLIEKLDEEYDRLCKGDLATLELRWKQRTGLLGKEVLVECQEATHYSGLLKELAWEGLELQMANGDPLLVPPEAIKYIQALGESSYRTR